MLATLAIIVWHFYHVIFDPDVYPLNFALIDGRISEELYKEENELDYDQMKRARSKAAAANEESEPPLTETSNRVEEENQTNNHG